MKSKPITLKTQVQTLTAALELAESRLKKEALQFVEEIQKKSLENLELSEENKALKQGKDFQRAIIERLRETCTSRLHLLTPEIQLEPDHRYKAITWDEKHTVNDNGNSDERKLLQYMIGILSDNEGQTSYSERDDFADAIRHMHHTGR